MKVSYKPLILSVIVLIIAFAGGCISDGGDDVDIRYGGQLYPEEYVLYADGGIWEEFDLLVEHILFSSGAEGNEALITGRVDVNVGSDSKTISLFNAIPDDALIIGTTQKGDRYTTIVEKDSNYQSWDDLIGKTVAVRLGTGAEAVLRMYFDENGYEWDDFNWVNLGVEDMIATLESGQIEAFTAWEPTPAIAEALNIGRAIRSYGDVSLVPVSIHTTIDFAEANHDVIVRFLAVQLYKAELIKTNPEEAALLAAEATAETGITVAPEAFLKVFERIDFSITLDQSIIDDIYETADFLLDQGKITEKPTLVWDDSYLEEAKEFLASR